MLAPENLGSEQALVAGDGTAISARLFKPIGQPKAAVLVASAMGVVQRFYAPFAAWLAKQGFVALSFDYRGMGESRPAEHRKSLRGFDADLFDWAADMDLAIASLRSVAPDLPLYVVGHSLGAQLPGLLKHRDEIAGLVSVAAGSGYWRDNAPQLRRMVLYFWHALVPVATHLFGYFPGTKIKKVGDLPKGVILQWRRWCLDPQYHVGSEGEDVRAQFASARFPIVALSITDDEMMTERGTQTLVDFYQSSKRQLVRLAPSDANTRRIGHFGFFRAQFEQSLWPKVPLLLAQFRAQAPG